jgi:hypothetical protein
MQSRAAAQRYDHLVIGGHDTHYRGAIQPQDPVKYCRDAHVRRPFQFVVSATPNLKPEHVRVPHFTGQHAAIPTTQQETPSSATWHTHRNPRRGT